jgi:hypothetical protein
MASFVSQNENRIFIRTMYMPDVTMDAGKVVY